MGDVGAHLLGLTFGWVILTGQQFGIPAHVTALPLGALLIDTTYTILRRLFRGERITQAHRYHLYQRLHRSGWSPVQVDGLYLVWTGLFGATALSLQSSNYAGTMLGLTAAVSLAIVVLTERVWATSNVED